MAKRVKTKARLTNSRTGESFPVTVDHKANGRPKKGAKAADTREGLIAEMSGVLDDVDRILATTTGQFNWRHGQGGALFRQRNAVDQLYNRMWALIDRETDDRAEDIFSAGVMTPEGTLPSYARPGFFVEWIGYVPVLVCWAGFMMPGLELRMIDPGEKWITSSGYQSIMRFEVSRDVTLREMARQLLTEASAEKNFNLHGVSDTGRNGAIAQLSASPWLQQILDIGPVDPIPLPQSLQAVQQSLFAV